jgi:hypothetical protein
MGPPDQYRKKLYIAYGYAFGAAYILDTEVVLSSTNWLVSQPLEHNTLLMEQTQHFLYK